MSPPLIRAVVLGSAIDTLPHLVDLDTTGLGVTVRPCQVKLSFSRVGP